MFTMETPNQQSKNFHDRDLHAINWSDIENTENDYENYLNDIEVFFRDDFENDIPEDETIKN